MKNTHTNVSIFFSYRTANARSFNTFLTKTTEKRPNFIYQILTVIQSSAEIARNAI